MRVCPQCQSVYTTRLEWCVLDRTQLVDQSADPLIGTQIERYRILEAIGTGGLGRVYHAKHAFIDREYAIKVLFGDFCLDPKFQERFRREANSASQIQHPNVVRVEDFGTTREGLTFLAMELIRGRTLGDAIREGPFAPERAVAIIRKVLDGLSAAHALGFVHRDVKPQNIMLAGDAVKILDFGTVAMRRNTEAERLTGAGDLVGTPAYMAPEQFHDASVGPTADLYAAGVILFEMLAGAPPFSGRGRGELLILHIMEPPPPLPPCGGAEGIVGALLRKDPKERPQSAAAAIEMIDRLRFDSVTTGDLDPPLISSSEIELIGFARSESDEFESSTVKEELHTEDGPTPQVIDRKDSEPEFYEPTRALPFETAQTAEVTISPPPSQGWLTKLLRWLGQT